MCPKRNLFATYGPVNEDVVLTVNDEPCKFIGVGTIK